MTDFPNTILGYEGIDNTTDPLILGRTNPRKSVLSYNLRSKTGAKETRPGLVSVVDFANNKHSRKSGIHFPSGAGVTFPLNTLELPTSFLLASQDYAGGAQYEFTIEFWYKMPHAYNEKIVCCVPTLFNGLLSPMWNHMCVKFMPADATSYHSGLYSVELELGLHNPAAPTEAGHARGYWAMPQTNMSDIHNLVPADGEWHHFAIERVYDGVSAYDVKVSIDGGAFVDLAYSTAKGGTPWAGASNYPLQAIDAYLEYYGRAGLGYPLTSNYFKICPKDTSISDFRIWNFGRDLADIVADKDSRLEGTEAGLIFYAKFDEGDGFKFTDIVSHTEGYMFPKEPFVNENGELTFTGYCCMALPSLRAYYKDCSDASTYPKDTVYTNHSEDAAYDGGILFDKKLNENAAPAWGDEGVYKGVAQIRLRLRSLGEGPIAGRLGLLWDNVQGKFSLYFYGSDDISGAGTEVIYRTNTAMIDASWIGQEHTITIFYDGTLGAHPNNNACRFYIDSVAYAGTAGTFHQWGACCSHGVPQNINAYDPFDESQGVYSTGAIGGSTAKYNMNMAFDLIFLRQWYGHFPDSEFPTTGFDPTQFLLETEQSDEVPLKHKLFIEKTSGYIHHNQNYLTIFHDLDMAGSGANDCKAYIIAPMFVDYETDDMANPGMATKSIIYTFNGVATNAFVKQDVIVKRIISWPAAQQAQVLPGAYTYMLTDPFKVSAGVGYKPFNGAIVSSLVTDLNKRIFREEKDVRPTIFTRPMPTAEVVNELKLYDVIVDGSPVQGIETFRGISHKSRYYILHGDIDPNVNASASGSRELHGITRYNQRSHLPRWCDSPFSSDLQSAIRGIYRYTSEDGAINKLLAVSWNCVYEIDAVSKELIVQDMAFIDRNEDSPINFILVNNKLIIADSKNAIKINHKGNFSRLGIETPVDVFMQLTAIYLLNFPANAQHAYVAQYYDEENDSYSGAIPVYGGLGQTWKVPAGTNRVHTEFNVRACKDVNVSHVILYRSANLTVNGLGVDQFLYPISMQKMTHMDREVVATKDVWYDDNMYQVEQLLPVNNLGQSLVPKPSAGMAVAYNRLFMIGGEGLESAVRWSEATAIGTPSPDMFPQLNRLILQDGEPSQGKALIWFGNSLYAFKEKSINRVYQIEAGQFGSEIIYKGAGCLNQRCILIAANSLFFLDENGLYNFASSEPIIVSEELTYFFENYVDLSDTEKPFMLFDKENFLILSFVPSIGSTYCDLCIIFDIRRQRFDVDRIQECSCGFVDYTDIYLGTPNGQILKYDPTVSYDVVNISGTGAVA